jgi:hypothetical protein
MNIAMPPITIGLVLAIIILILAVIGLVGVLPLNPLIVFGLFAGLAIARLL